METERRTPRLGVFLLPKKIGQNLKKLGIRVRPALHSCLPRGKKWGKMVTVPIKWWKYGRLCGECMSDEQKRVKPDAGDDLANEADYTETTGRKSGTRASDHHFAGAYSHGIDSKGRMIIPANFRTALGDHFVVALTPDFKHIALYPEEEWLNRQDKLQKLADLDARVQRLIEMFNKYSYLDSETDAQGRLLLPQKMRAKYLDNCREVEVSGGGSYIRVLKKETDDTEDVSFRQDYPDPLAFLAEVQRGAGK